MDRGRGRGMGADAVGGVEVGIEMWWSILPRGGW